MDAIRIMERHGAQQGWNDYERGQLALQFLDKLIQDGKITAQEFDAFLRQQEDLIQSHKDAYAAGGG
jgi:hypothetical protein